MAALPQGGQGSGVAGTMQWDPINAEQPVTHLQGALPVGGATRPHIGQDERAGLVPIFMGASSEDEAKAIALLVEGDIHCLCNDPWVVLRGGRGQLILHLQHHALAHILEQSDDLIMAEPGQVDPVH